MKPLITEITREADTWTATITNGNGLRVHIQGCETKEIARQQADDRINELKRGGLL